MTVDSVEEGGDVDELVARVDELEVKEFLLARHEESLALMALRSMGKKEDPRLRAAERSCELRPCLQLTCII